MSLVLSPELQARQNTLKRNPIINILSENPVAAIPFDGYEINGGSTADTKSRLFLHSSGALVFLYTRSGANAYPYMETSDPSRSVWGAPVALFRDGQETTVSVEATAPVRRRWWPFGE